jgi:hypothetical protein
MSNLPKIYIASSLRLPDNDQWQLRFEVKSETSDRIYIISQNKKKKHWGCSCFAYRRYRKCKHLQAIGLPTNEVPYEAELTS